VRIKRGSCRSGNETKSSERTKEKRIDGFLPGLKPDGRKTHEKSKKERGKRHGLGSGGTGDLGFKKRLKGKKKGMTGKKGGQKKIKIQENKKVPRSIKIEGN